VLVEYSMITAPLDLQEILFDLQMEGYQPVIAHPERYVYLSRRKEFFEELRAAGCLFQLNLLSLAGHYGSSVQDLAEYLMKGDFYEFAGTDMHSLRHLELMQKLPAPLINRLRDSGKIRNSTL
jgi:protein-tyrosine phosphatase